MPLLAYAAAAVVIELCRLMPFRARYAMLTRERRDV